MTAAIGFKRLAIAVAAMVSAAFVTLIALSFLIPAASVRNAVKAEIHAVTGLDPLLGDDVSLSLFPSGSVRFRNVLLGDDRTGEPAVAADELTARLRYFPLLAGRIEIADVTLVHPTINVTFSADRAIELVGPDRVAGACAAAGSGPHRFILGNRHPRRHGRRARRGERRHRAA